MRSRGGMLFRCCALLVACALAVLAGSFASVAAEDPSASSLPPLLSQIDVWPLPQEVRGGSQVGRVSPSSFRFLLDNASFASSCGEGCGLLISGAVQRLRRTLFLAEQSTEPYRRASFPPIVNGTTHLEDLLRSAGVSNPLAHLIEFAQLEILPPSVQRGSLSAEDLESASEAYTLQLTQRGGTLAADTELGLLHGLETFRQLVRWMGSSYQYVIGPLPLLVADAPRFKWRGLMVDTARHFLPVGHIFRTLDGMAAMKLNVFHWHFSDAQSFSYRSDAFPRLSDLGAYAPGAAYSRDQVKEVIRFALSRGIRVVPEFDVPAHTASWGKGHPELVAACEDTLRQGEVNGDFEKQIDKVAMRPLADTTWDFLGTFFREVLETFPDPYLHLGTDEVNGDCWVADPDVAAFKDQHGYDWRQRLEAMFRRRLEKLIRAASVRVRPRRRRPVRFVLWDSESLSDIDQANADQDASSADAEAEAGIDEASNGVALAQTWRFWDQSQPVRLHRAGWKTLQSEGWYLDFTGDGWDKFYAKQLPSDGSVLGGEACSWSEHANEANYFHRVFQRLPATAERLWSAESVTDQTAAEARLALFLCHGLRWRGIPTGPIRPDFCDVPPAVRASSGSLAAVSSTMTAAEAELSLYANFGTASLSRVFRPPAAVPAASKAEEVHMEVDPADGSVLHTSTGATTFTFGSAPVRISAIVVLGAVAVLAAWSRRSSLLCPTAASVGPGAATTSSAQDSPSYSRVQIVDVAANTASTDDEDDAVVPDHDAELDSQDSDH